MKDIACKMRKKHFVCRAWITNPSFQLGSQVNDGPRASFSLVNIVTILHSLLSIVLWSGSLYILLAWCLWINVTWCQKYTWAPRFDECFPPVRNVLRETKNHRQQEEQSSHRLRIYRRIFLFRRNDIRGNLATNCRRFKRVWENYEIVTGFKDKTNELRVATVNLHRRRCLCMIFKVPEQWG